MNKKEYLIAQHLPSTDITHLESLFAELLLWYDKPYCKSLDGANEVIGEYMASKHEDYFLNEASTESQTLDQHEVEEEFCTCCRCSPCQCAQQDIDQYISSNC